MRNLQTKSHLSSWDARLAFHSQNREDEFLTQYFKGKTGGYLIDIAAADGITGSNSFRLINEFDWNGLLVEPCKVHEKNLDNLYKDISGIKVFKGAVHQTLKEVDFNEVEFQEIGLSNINGGHPAAQHYQHRTYKVPALDINSLLTHYAVPEQIDFISLDIEGAESEVVNYWNFDRYQVKLWCIEEGRKFENHFHNHGYRLINPNFVVGDFRIGDALYEKI